MFNRRFKRIGSPKIPQTITVNNGGIKVWTNLN